MEQKIQSQRLDAVLEGQLKAANQEKIEIKPRIRMQI